MTAKRKNKQEHLKEQSNYKIDYKKKDNRTPWEDRARGYFEKNIPFDRIFIYIPYINRIKKGTRNFLVPFFMPLLDKRDIFF